MKNISVKNYKKIHPRALFTFGMALFLFLLIIPRKTFAFDLLLSGSVKPAYQVLQNDTSIKNIWQMVLNLANSFVIIVLIAVAFAQILRININTYGVKKILPALVLAIVAANFSYLFCRLMVDFANVIMAGLIHGTGNASNLTGVLNGGWADPANSAFSGGAQNLKNDGGIVFWFIIIQFLLIASGILIYILALLFFVRLWLIYFLVPLAPLAFMAMVLPQTKNLFNQWLSNFFKWVFMPIVSVLWIWLGSKWLGVVGSGWFMQVVFAGMCFYLAITTPFKMGGVVMNGWSKVGKWGLGRTGLPGAYNYFKDKGAATWAARKQGTYNLVKEKTGLGTGLDAAKAKLNRVQERQSAISGRATEKANSGRRAQAELQGTINIQLEGKEIGAKGKKSFVSSSKGKAMFTQALRAETRTVGATKDTEALTDAVKRDYFANADPKNARARAELKAEIQSYLRSNADSVIAKAEVEKSEKSVTNKLMVDRMAYQNAIDSGNAAAVAEIERQIRTGTNWATMGHTMTSTEKSRSKAKVDAMLAEEAQIDLNKDAATIESEMFSGSYDHMLAQRPELVTDTDVKIEYLAKNKAVDKILATRSGGRVSPEAEAMAKKLLTHLSTVGMDTRKETDLVTEIVRRHNANASTAAQLAPTVTTFADLDASSTALNMGSRDKQIFLTAMRSKLTQPRESEKA